MLLAANRASQSSSFISLPSGIRLSRWASDGVGSGQQCTAATRALTCSTNTRASVALCVLNPSRLQVLRSRCILALDADCSAGQRVSRREAHLPLSSSFQHVHLPQARRLETLFSTACKTEAQSFSRRAFPDPLLLCPCTPHKQTASCDPAQIRAGPCQAFSSSFFPGFDFCYLKK